MLLAARYGHILIAKKAQIMPRLLWPGDVLQLHDQLVDMPPGLYVVTDFPPGTVELRATWRNEDGLLSPTASAWRLDWPEVWGSRFLPLRRNLFCERGRAELRMSAIADKVSVTQFRGDVMPYVCTNCGRPIPTSADRYVPCPNCGTRHRAGLTINQRAARRSKATRDKKHQERLATLSTPDAVDRHVLLTDAEKVAAALRDIETVLSSPTFRTPRRTNCCTWSFRRSFRP